MAINQADPTKQFAVQPFKQTTRRRQASPISFSPSAVTVDPLRNSISPWTPGRAGSASWSYAPTACRPSGLDASAPRNSSQ